MCELVDLPFLTENTYNERVNLPFSTDNTGLSVSQSVSQSVKSSQVSQVKSSQSNVKQYKHYINNNTHPRLSRYGSKLIFGTSSRPTLLENVDFEIFDALQVLLGID